MADFGQIGEAFVDIRANFGTFQTDLAGAQRKIGRQLQTVGAGFTQGGRSLSIGMTLQLIAAAGAAVKFGSDFSREMTKIQTLVGLSETRVASLGKEVLALSKTVAVGPQGMAISATTGILGWRPRLDQAGTHDVILRGRDGRDGGGGGD